MTRKTPTNQQHKKGLFHNPSLPIALRLLRKRYYGNNFGSLCRDLDINADLWNEIEDGAVPIGSDLLIKFSARIRCNPLNILFLAAMPNTDVLVASGTHSIANAFASIASRLLTQVGDQWSDVDFQRLSDLVLQDAKDQLGYSTH